MTDDEVDYAASLLARQWGLTPKPPPKLGFAITLENFSRLQQLLGRSVGLLQGLVMQLPDGDYKKQMTVEIDRYDRQVAQTLYQE